jgi:hypothetical protein
MSESALPLVVRIERADPPQRTDALEAAARAVLLLLTADVADWQEDVRAWDGARIRKVVRRARGADWRRAAALPGLTVTHRTAEVRIFPPVPVDGWPPELARLQVGGTELTDDAPPGPPPAGAPLLLLSPLAPMSTGKAMAQAGHAAQLGWRASARHDQLAWRDSGFPVAVRDATVGRWEQVLRSGLPVVQDGGFTEVAPGTCTAAAVLPWLGAAARVS